MHDDDAVDELAELRSLARGLPPEEAWEEPPAGLWASIASAAGVDPRGVSDEPVADTAEGTPGAASESGEPPAGHVPPDNHGRAGVVPMEGRRRRGFGAPRSTLLVAACVLAVVIAGAAVIARVVGPSEEEPASVIAASDLEALGDRGRGRAELVDHAGNLELRVDLGDLDPGDGFLEVWMIDPTVTGLVSLGPVRADGTYALPPGIDPADFPIVDVSVEPIDGDPTHSGASVLRGQLEI